MFEIELFVCIKMDFVLNNLQRLIHHKTSTTIQPTTTVDLSVLVVKVLDKKKMSEKTEQFFIIIATNFNDLLLQSREL